MSAVGISNKMEILIPDDVFKDMMEPGKVFQRHLEPLKSQEENSQRPLASLILEKMAGDVIKLIVSVNKHDDVSTGEKSDNCKVEVQQNEVSNSSQQTDNAETENRLMQTDKRCEKSQQQQTEKKEFKETGMQTTHKEFVENAIQTDAKKFCESQCQTVIKEFKETKCQTIIKEYKESPCQTVIKEFSEAPCQTLFSLANLRESECQATVVMCDGGSQISIETIDHGIQATTVNTDGVSQTEIDTNDNCVQTEKDEGEVNCQTDLSMLFMCEQTCQTEVETASCDAQTESSLAWRGDFGCQMAPETTELSAQTEPNEVRTVLSQTEISTQYAETQTVPDLSNRETQTDELLTVTVEEPPQNADQNVPAENLPPENVPMEGDLILPSADIQSITPLDAAPVLQAEKKAAHAQTDPVTIIIGDAGFLVERLKGSAIKTERRDREIEIEFAENGTAEVRPKSRSGYIPGSGLANPLSSPPMQGRIPIEKLKSTPVQPFNPRSIENIQMLRSPAGPSPRKPTPVVRREPEKITPIKTVTQPEDRTDVGEKQELSCPFCDVTFPESTILYNHITKVHNEKRKKTHYKPKGREGMTITPRRPRSTLSDAELEAQMPPHVRASVERYRQMAISAGQTPPGHKGSRGIKAKSRLHASPGNSAEPGYQPPPVLEPVYMIDKVQLVGDDGQHFRPSPSGRTYKRQAPKIEAEPNLFEDLPEPKRAYPRGRVRREEEDDEGSSAPRAQVDAYEYECPHCPERYGSASHLYGHLKRSHKTEMEQQRAQGSLSEDDEQESGEGAESSGGDQAHSSHQQPGVDPSDVVQEEGSGGEQGDEDGEEEGEGVVRSEEDAVELGGEDEAEHTEGEAEHTEGEAEPIEGEAERDVEDEHVTGEEEQGGDEEHDSAEYQREEQPQQGKPVKRRRSSVGRPKQKRPRVTEGAEEGDMGDEPTPKKRAGRPRKDTTPADGASSKKTTRVRKPRT